MPAIIRCAERRVAELDARALAANADRDAKIFALEGRLEHSKRSRETLDESLGGALAELEKAREEVHIFLSNAPFLPYVAHPFLPYLRI